MAAPTVVAYGTHDETDPTNSATVTLPTTQSGDLILVGFTARAGTGGTGNLDVETLNWTPDGTLIEELSSTPDTWFYYGWATGDHSGEYVYVEESAAGSMCGVYLVIRGAIGSGDPTDGYASERTGANTDLTLTGGITTTYDDSLVIYVMACRNDATVTAASMDGTSMPIYADAISLGGSDSSLTTAALAQGTAGSTGDLAFTSGVNTFKWLIGIGIRAAAAPSGVDLTPATESEAAQAVTRKKLKGATPATEGNAAQALSSQKRKGITAATEADAAQSITHKRLATLTPATEADVAQGLTQKKLATLLVATETDLAIPVTRAAVANYVDLTPAAESDLAVALSAQKVKTLGVALETDTAAALSHLRRVTAGTATESDAAVAPTVRKHGSVLPAAESDVAFGISASLRRSLTAATETDGAVGLSASKRVSLSPATEADSAVGISHYHRVYLVPAEETDNAVPISREGVEVAPGQGKHPIGRHGLIERKPLIEEDR